LFAYLRAQSRTASAIWTSFRRPEGWWNKDWDVQEMDREIDIIRRVTRPAGRQAEKVRLARGSWVSLVAKDKGTRARARSGCKETAKRRYIDEVGAVPCRVAGLESAAGRCRGKPDTATTAAPHRSAAALQPAGTSRLAPLRPPCAPLNPLPRSAELVAAAPARAGRHVLSARDWEEEGGEGMGRRGGEGKGEREGCGGVRSARKWRCVVRRVARTRSGQRTVRGRRARRWEDDTAETPGAPRACPCLPTSATVRRRVERTRAPFGKPDQPCPGRRRPLPPPFLRPTPTP